MRALIVSRPEGFGRRRASWCHSGGFRKVEAVRWNGIRSGRAGKTKGVGRSFDRAGPQDFPHQKQILVLDAGK